MTEASLAEQYGDIFGAARKLETGRYHVTDMLRSPLAQLYDQYVGREPVEGIDSWLSARGHGFENAALDMMGIPGRVRQPEIRYAITDDAYVTGHPEYIVALHGEDLPSFLAPFDVADEEVVIEIGEVKSQLSADDPARRDLALEQALTYAGLVNRGAEIRYDDGAKDSGVAVDQVRPILAGLWDLDDNETYPVSPDITERLVEYVVEKASVLDQALRDEDRAMCEAFDEREPPLTPEGIGPPPVAEGEEGEVARQAVYAKVAMDHLEALYDAARERFEARWTEEWEDQGRPDLADVDGFGRVEEPETGARLQLWTRKEKDVAETDRMRELQEAIEDLELRLEEKEQDAIREVREANPDLLTRLEALREELETEEEGNTYEKKVPHYVRVLGQGDVSPRDAVQWAFHEVLPDVTFSRMQDEDEYKVSIGGGLRFTEEE